MSDGKKLEDLVSNLSRQFEETKNSLKNVVQKQSGTNESLSEMKVAQSQLNSEIDTLQKDIQNLESNQQGQHDLMTDRLIQLKGQLVDFDRKLNSQNQNLLSIINHQNKESDRAQLEHKRGHILVQMQSLLREIRDGSVSYALCSRGLTKLAMDGIVPGAFQSLENMSKAEQIIAELKRRRDEVDEGARFETENFEAADRLFGEISNESQRYKSAKLGFDKLHDSLTKERSSLAQTLAQIEIAQKKTQPKKGGIGIWIATVVFLVIGLGLISNPRAGAQYDLGVMSLFLTMALLVIGIIMSVRRRALNFSIERRSKAIEKMKSDIESIESRLLKLKEDAQKEDDMTLGSLPTYREKIKKLGIRFKKEGFQINPKIDNLRSTPIVETFEVLISELAKLRDAWIAQHPEMKRVIDSKYI